MGNHFFGSKAAAGLWQAIIALMPPHSVYQEIHLGQGVIMKRKPPAQRNIGIDLDARAIERFSCDYPVELVHGCCHEYVSQFPYDGSELIFADPPYVRATRKAPQRYRYRCDYEDADHVELLELLCQVPCQVMICGYPSALYDEWIGDWNSLEMQVMNQAGVVTEKIWFNFECDRVFWPRYAGRNAMDRQRIRRRAESWSSRCREMPPAERLAILSAMLAVESE